MPDQLNYVIIDSKYRNENSKSSSDFVYSLGEAIEVSQVAIKSISVVNAEYNIKAGKNTLLVNDGVSDIPITINVGQYDIAGLIAAVENEMTAVLGGTNVITLSSTTFKLSFSTSSVIKYKINRSDSALACALGLGDSASSIDEYYPQFTSALVSAPFLPQLQGANNFHILSYTLAQGQGSLLKNNEKRPIVLTVPVTSEFGGVVSYEINEINLNKRNFSRPVNIQEIDIRIVDDDNEIVNLGGTNVEIVLQVIKSSTQAYSVQSNQTTRY